MANGDDIPLDKPANHREIARQQAAGIADVIELDKLQQLLTNAIQEGGANALAAAMKSAIGILTFVTRTLAEGEDRAVGELGRLAEVAIKDLLDVDVSVSAFSARGGKSVNTGGETAIGAAILEALTRGGASLEPSDDAAKRFLTTILNFTLEGWVQATTVNTITAVIPYVDAVTQFGELDDMLAQSLGLGRLSRRVINPLLQARVITPFQWLVNKQYRPELLSANLTAQAFFRGRFTFEEAREELARQGWSDERIEMIIAAAARTLSVADAALAVRRGAWTEEDARQHLRDQGYPVETAELALKLQDARDIEAFEAQLAGVAVTAYADRRIDRAQFTDVVRASVTDPRAANRLIELGETRRALNIRHLSSGEVEGMVKHGVLAFVDYRRALERDGYDDIAIAAKELDLRFELQDIKDLEAARAARDAELAAERQRRAAERARREAELAEKRARAFPALTEYKRGYVRGLISLSLYETALAREKIQAEDAALLIADAELARAEHLEQLERRRQAEARDVDPVVPIAAVEASVLRGILSLEDYRADLARRKFDEAEIRVLTNLLANRLEDQRQAAAARAAAERLAALRAVSLSTWERAVRMGVRTVQDYSDFITSLGTPDVARALILDLLQAQIRADDVAREQREGAEPAARARGISLEQRRRAVLQRIRPIDYYEEGLRATTLPVDEQLVLFELLEAELEAADEARARRAEIEARDSVEELPLATIERAVVLGVLEPDALRERALAKGFTADDAELLVSLALLRLTDVRRGQVLERQVAGELAGKRISLADQKAIVKRGLRPLEEYFLFLQGQGYAGDDLTLLVQLLEEEIAADVDGLRQRIAAKLAKADNAPALAEIEAALVAGELDVATTRDVLVSFGAARDEALVYARLILLFPPEG